MKCNYLKNLKIDKLLKCDIYGTGKNKIHDIYLPLYSIIDDSNIDLTIKLKNDINKIFDSSNFIVEIVNDRFCEGGHNYQILIKDKALTHTFQAYFLNEINDLIFLKKQFIQDLPSLTESFDKAYQEYIMNCEEYENISEDYVLEMNNILQIKNKQKVFQ